MTWEVSVKSLSSGVHGMGVFASQNIEKGSVIWRVDSSMHFCDEAELRKYDNNKLHIALLSGYLHYQTGKFVWFEDGMQHMNHAPTGLANIYTPHHTELLDDCVVAAKPINKGDELFEDYGYWNIFNLQHDHWLRRLYAESCPDHYMFMQYLADEAIAA
ncbi:MAG: SET domain-containing protein [Paracoccaceae bacterium]